MESPILPESKCILTAASHGGLRIKLVGIMQTDADGSGIDLRIVRLNFS
jgi:hypothetical protein